MTKADLIDGLANKLGLNKNEAEKAVNIVLDDVINALKQGDRVNISGFGTFSVSTRQARVGRNPKTGDEVPIAPRRVLVFRPSHVLKAVINGQTPSPEGED